MTLEEALHENEQLRRENAALRAENAQLHKRLGDLEKLVRALQEQLLEAQRANKRQAAPFSKGEPKANPKKPGRKRRHKGAFREPPKHVDTIKEARLPEACPECGGAVSEERVDAQYQIDIPRVKPKTTQFNVHVGQCIACGCRLQGRHPEQTSNALGRAAVQIGPRALSLAAEAKHLLGVPYGKIAHFFQKAFGLRVNRSTLARADQRVAQAHHSSYEQIQQVVQASPATHVDETGWKVAGRLAWLWTAATRQATLYLIHRRRGHEVVEDLLGPAYPGKLICDSFLAYEALEYPQQKCLQHLIRRGLELEAIKLGRAKKFGQAVAHLLRQAIHLRHRFQAGEHSVHGYAIACGRVEAACNRLLIGRLVDEDNVRLFNLLRRQRHRLFAFLYDEDLEPTNALAEQALRPAVAIRKMSACNRSWRGAHVHTILMSVLRTCRQQGQDFLSWTIQRLRSREELQPLWLTGLASQVP